MDQLLAIWKETTAALIARFEALNGEQLSVESPCSFPVPDKTIRGAIGFMAYHEAYHVGQMAYLRKWLRSWASRRIPAGCELLASPAL